MMAAERASRVVVTGGAGFIGSHTVEALVADRYAVLVIDDLSHPCGAPLPRGVELVAADVGSEEAERALRAFRPDLVLHLASKGGVERAGRDPSWHVRASVASTVALFAIAVEAGARRLVTASSGGALYGDAPRLPVSERRPPAPRSVYGCGKLAEEGYLAMLGRLHGVETMALRYGNVYGPRQDGTGEAGVVAITCTRLLRDEEPVIFGDGGQSRDFVFVGDVVRANRAALASRRSGVVNIGTGRDTTVRTLIEQLVRLHGGTSRLIYAPARGSEVRRSCLDPGRAASWLGWSSGVSLAGGLAATLSSFAAQSLMRGDAGMVPRDAIASRRS
jgi:UDP-glucose 4-epimerase